MTAPVLHRSQDISTHPEFEDELYHVKLLLQEDPWMFVFEYSAGLRSGEFDEATDCAENHIPVQLRMADCVELCRFAFVPTKTILEDIYELFERNNLSAPHSRVPFYMTQSLRDYVYTFEVREDFTDPLYTRHPITGVVTEHICPYPQLPLFTTTAHPCVSIFQAWSFQYGRSTLARPRTEQPLLDVISKSLLIWSPSIPRRAPSPTQSGCPSLTHSSDSASSEELSEADCRITDWVQEVQVVSRDEFSPVHVRSYANDEPVVRFEGVTMDDGDWRELAVMTRPELELKSVPKRALRSRVKVVRPSRIPRRIRSGRPLKLR
ncbi:hypothetical protein CYLTODRAFT_494182 [Cylindrobasidium torrendii FP15055 ss-10]|uniref:Uncharacterized protein n=1 Tax=Cylindrobasidium torrendii FP15055 ss-10 TaxID=1314674 RepID=A0A0D7AXH1_9AGAR|nr:hypothetical protein CYLTODRAFT_494182 [Cylindrobasidium torrendii FP15055 ss-10]